MKRKRDKICDKESALMADWLSSSSSSMYPQDSHHQSHLVKKLMKVTHHIFVVIKMIDFNYARCHIHM